MKKAFNKTLEFDDGIRLVAINEAGDTASVSINDATLPERFMDFIRWFEDRLAEIKVLEESKQNLELPRDIDTLYSITEKRVEICQTACEMLDGLFGEGVCRKVFEVDVPDEHCIVDFVDQMVPFVEWAFGEKIVMKYNRNRKGGRM